MNLGGAPSHAMQYRSHTVNLALKARASSTQFQPFINTSQHMCFENKHHRSDNFHQLQDNRYRKYFPRSAQMHGKCTEEHTLPFSCEAAKALKTYWQNRCGTLVCTPISSPIFFAIELSSVGAVGPSTPTLFLRRRAERAAPHHREELGEFFASTIIRLLSPFKPTPTPPLPSLPVGFGTAFKQRFDSQMSFIAACTSTREGLEFSFPQYEEGPIFTYILSKKSGMPSIKLV